ncbi:MAG TPA: hypothetical protein V6D29_24215, partial [Leptolyngbyaceae cyanobacterium]
VGVGNQNPLASATPQKAQIGMARATLALGRQSGTIRLRFSCPSVLRPPLGSAKVHESWELTAAAA